MFPSWRGGEHWLDFSTRLLQSGVGLFLLGRLTGFAIAVLANPRMGLSSHREGVMNGTFLVLLGRIWERLVLPSTALRVAFWVTIYGTFANWATTLVAAFHGTGESMMPIAAPGELSVSSRRRPRLRASSRVHPRRRTGSGRSAQGPSGRPCRCLR